jgi:GABA(A) receptor-associated protein
MSSSFRTLHSFEKRKGDSKKVREKYPDRIPIIIEKNPKSQLPALHQIKFLVPQNLTAKDVLYIIRKRIKLNHSDAIYIFINNSIPPSGALLSILYDQHKDDDGFLYITYTGENTFG